MKFIKFLSLLFVLFLTIQVNCAAKLDGEVKAATDQQISKIKFDPKVIVTNINNEIHPWLHKLNFKKVFEIVIEKVDIFFRMNIDEDFKNQILNEACKILNKYENLFMPFVYRKDKKVCDFINKYRIKNKFFEKVFARYSHYKMQKKLNEKDFHYACINAIEAIKIIYEYKLYKLNDFNKILEACYNCLEQNKTVVLELLEDDDNLQFFIHCADDSKKFVADILTEAAKINVETTVNEVRTCPLTSDDDLFDISD